MAAKIHFPWMSLLSVIRLVHKMLNEAAQSAFFAISPEDLPRATFAETIESIVEPLFSPAHFPAQKTASAVWEAAKLQQKNGDRCLKCCIK